MAYRLHREESVADSIARIGCEQIDKAIAEIDNPELSIHVTVHQVRKRCKKLRGLVRLVRPALGKTYAKENAFYRDAAASLAAGRDAQSIVETFDKLVGHFADHMEGDVHASIRAELMRRRELVVEDGGGLKDRVAAFRDSMLAGRKRIDSWSFADSGFDAVAGGLLKTYDRARRALRTAYDDGTAESFHDWRKRVKYHWYHTRLLRDLWPQVLQGRRAECKRLADLLGDDHDLAVLRQTLLDQPHALGYERNVYAFVSLVDRRQIELRDQAHPIGRRLFAEKTKRLGKRFEEYWDAWQSEPWGVIDGRMVNNTD